MNLSRSEFEALVLDAMDSLPTYFQDKIDNVEILIKNWPSRRELIDAGVPPDHTLLGLYSGVPLTERTHNYGLVTPDTIILYQGPIEQAAEDNKAIPGVVRHTIIHELAHHFGISDDRLRELGAY